MGRECTYSPAPIKPPANIWLYLDMRLSELHGA
ncbi:MAG: hypothetical protein QOE27_1686 [Solirubrobacteraceae bacterium]|nr:hypothetical protein [Solirubrobacteraceae bacterium]MEA2355761.1 hypothetical protein [Solirubrobacteraceae bacterium]